MKAEKIKPGQRILIEGEPFYVENVGSGPSPHAPSGTVYLFNLTDRNGNPASTTRDSQDEIEMTE